MHIVGEGGSEGLGQVKAKCKVQHYFPWLNYSGAVTVVICCEYTDNNEFLYTVVLATYLESLWASRQVTDKSSSNGKLGATLYGHAYASEVYH